MFQKPLLAATSVSVHQQIWNENHCTSSSVTINLTIVSLIMGSFLMICLRRYTKLFTRRPFETCKLFTYINSGIVIRAVISNYMEDECK